MAVFLTASAAEAADLKLLTTGAFEPVVQVIVAEFQKQSGHSVKVERDTAGALNKRIAGGESFDVAVITPNIIDQLAKDGKLVAESHVKVATVGVGVGIRDGAAKPDISSAEALKVVLLAAKAVAYIDPASGGTSGIYVDKMLERLGIAEQVRPKAKLKKGGHAADFVASGEADVVLQQISEIIPVKGVTLVGPLPAEVQNITTYSAALSTQTQQREAAQALLEILSSPVAASVLKSKGMEPVS